MPIEHDLIVLSDEIYNRLSYDSEHVSLYGIDGMAERTIYMDGLSKAWAMCGWRLGFGAMPVAIAKKMDTLMINSSSCAAAFTQWAAVEAFEAPEFGGRGGEHGRRVRTPARSHRRSPQRDSRLQMPSTGRRVLRLSRHHREPASTSASWRRHSSTRSGSQCCRARRSDRTEPATSVSATPPRSRISRRQRAGSRSMSVRRSLRDDTSMARPR